VGFTGHMVFGRSDRPLLEAPAFDAVRPPSGDGARSSSARPGGWQMLEFGDGEWDRQNLSALVAWSGAPACVAVVYDSDVADVVGLTPDGRTWQTVLNLEVAAATSPRRPAGVLDDLEWIASTQYAEEVVRRREELEAAVAEGVSGALAWAAAAGFGSAADAVAVETSLRSHGVFVEDLFVDLLDTLGFPPAAEPANEEHAYS
jgi:hypothetical protein